jgi:hypothetical protein
MPLTAITFHSAFAPDKDDDFGMGPFLSGAIFGGVLCVVAGVASVAIGVRMRAVRPLNNRWLLAVERIVLVSPPAGMLAVAAGLISGSPIGGGPIYLAAVALVLLSLR